MAGRKGSDDDHNQEKENEMSVEERVKKIIVEQLGVNAEEVAAESAFVEDLGADSLDTVELVMAFEEEFDLEIPDEDAEKVTPEASFVDDLGADSLDVVELVMAFEEEFGVEIPDEAAEKIATVKDAIEYLQKNVAA